jgi:hypothetical protein
MSIQQQAIVKAVNDLADSLPAKGKLEVLKHLLDTVDAKALKGISAEGRQQLLSILPEVPASNAQPSVSTPTKRGQFAEAYSGEHCKLEVRSTRLGREVRLTINAGSTLEKAFDEINAKSQEKYNRDAIYRGNLYKDAGVKDVMKETTVITFTPVLKNSANRVKFGTDAETSHEALLKKHGLDFVDRPHQTAAAGAYRIAKGFKEGVSVGSTEDKGDLFEGLVARSRSGAVVTSDGYGVFDCDSSDVSAFNFLVVSGRSSSN